MNGRWKPAKTVIDYIFGHDDFFAGVSEQADGEVGQRSEGAALLDHRERH